VGSEPPMLRRSRTAGAPDGRAGVGWSCSTSRGASRLRAHSTLLKMASAVCVARACPGAGPFILCYMRSGSKPLAVLRGLRQRGLGLTLLRCPSPRRLVSIGDLKLKLKRACTHTRLSVRRSVRVMQSSQRSICAHTLTGAPCTCIIVLAMLY
jgi:hypothetical protein